MKTTLQIIQSNNWKSTLSLMAVGALTLVFTTGAKPPAGSSSSDIPLSVTIETIGTVASDGLGAYRNGEKGVTAVFTAGQGRFRFDTGTRRKANVAIPGFLSQGNYRVDFLISSDVQDPNVLTNPDPNWHDLDLDQLVAGVPVPVGLAFIITTSPSDTGTWKVAFGDYPLRTEYNAFPCAGAAPAWVKRIDATTWVLFAEESADHCLSHGFIDDRDFPQIAFPFAMTLRRI